MRHPRMCDTGRDHQTKPGITLAELEVSLMRMAYSGATEVAPFQRYL